MLFGALDENMLVADELLEVGVVLVDSCVRREDASFTERSLGRGLGRKMETRDPFDDFCCGGFSFGLFSLAGAGATFNPIGIMMSPVDPVTRKRQLSRRRGKSPRREPFGDLEVLTNICSGGRRGPLTGDWTKVGCNPYSKQAPES